MSNSDFVVESFYQYKSDIKSTMEMDEFSIILLVIIFLIILYAFVGNLLEHYHVSLVISSGTSFMRLARE